MTEIIAEIGINHNGDLELAKRMIDIAVSAGCDYVKFQKRNINICFSREELKKARNSPWGVTVEEYKKQLELSRSAYNEIDKYCKDRIIWFASPWDLQSIDFLMKYDPPLLKIPSALITDIKYLKECRLRAVTRGLQIVLSTGMSDETMVKKAISTIGLENIHSVLHCVSSYPSKSEELNLSYIKKLKGMYPDTKIGFSNHHPGLLGMITAVAYGAEVLEMHITLDRSMYGSDQAASIEPPGLFKMVKYCKEMKRMKGSGIKEILESEIPKIESLRRV